MFDWKFYFLFAELLIDNPVVGKDDANREQELQANYRAALSRAYYGIFQLTHNYLRDKELDPVLLMPIRQQQGVMYEAAELKENEKKLSKIHSYVQAQLRTDAFDKRKNQLRRGLRTELATLQERRIEADYREGIVFQVNTVKHTLKSAKTALSYLEQLKR